VVVDTARHQGFSSTITRRASRADIEMTKKVRDAVNAVGIALHDHLVIGRSGHASFKALGLL